MAHLLWDKVPFAVLAFATSIATYYAQSGVGTVMGIDRAPLYLRVVNALSSYMTYIYKMFWPHNLAVIYPLPHSLPVLPGAISGLLLLGISVFVYRYRKEHPYLVDRLGLVSDNTAAGHRDRSGGTAVHGGSVYLYDPDRALYYDCLGHCRSG